MDKFISCNRSKSSRNAHKLAAMPKDMIANALAWVPITVLEMEPDGLMFLKHFLSAGDRNRLRYV